MDCWVNGENCIHGLINSFSQNDTLKGTCRKCANFVEEDLEKNFRALGFVPLDHNYFFDEEEIDTLYVGTEILEDVLIEKIKTVEEHLTLIRAKRKNLLQKTNSNCSDKGLEDLVESDFIFCEYESYLGELEDLKDVFEK